MSKRGVKNAFCVVVIFLTMFCVTGCFDLGDFKDEQDYYHYFPNVDVIDENCTASSFSMQKFYNDESVNDFVCDLENSKYKYVGVRISDAINIEEFSMYVTGGEGTLSLEFYLTKSMPSKIKVKEPEEGEEEPEYDEPKSEDAIAKTSVSVSENTWNSFTIKSWSGNKKLAVGSGDILLIKMVNNCFQDEKVLSEISFKFTNILICGVKD